MNLDQKLELLQAAEPFALLDPEDRRSLAQQMMIREFPYGDTVFSRGDAGDFLCLVASGKARVIGIDAAGKEVSLDLLERGSHFGEQAVLSGSPRTATVRAAEDLVVLVISREDFLIRLKQSPGSRRAFEQYITEIGIQNFLKQFTLLGATSPRRLRDLVRDLKPLRVQSGQVVIREGETDDHLYIVRHGSLAVVKAGPDGDRTIGHIGEGEFFGELALLRNEPRSATVVAHSDSGLYQLPAQSFKAALEASPELRKRLEQLADLYQESAVPVVDPRDMGPITPEAENPPPPMGGSAWQELLAKPGVHAAVQAPWWRRLFRLYPFVAQHDLTDCGAACLAMMARYYGLSLGVSRLRDMANVDRDGATLWSLAQAAETIGFSTRGYQMATDALAGIAMPAIIHWEGFHYVVLYAITSRYAILGDPAVGIRRLSIAQFRKGFSGRVLELTPTSHLRQAEAYRITYRHFAAVAWRHAGGLLWVFLASIALNILGLGLPLFTQFIIDKGVPGGATELLDALFLVLLAVAAFQAGLTLFRHLFLIRMSARFDQDLTSLFLGHVMRLPMRFFDLRRVGDVLSRVGENDKIRDAMVGLIPSMFLDSCLALGYLILLGYYNPAYMMVVLAALPLFLLTLAAFTPAIRRSRREYFVKHADQSSTLIESITGIATVKAMAIEPSVQHYWGKRFVEALGARSRSAQVDALAISISLLISTAASTLFLWFGAQQVLLGNMTLGQLMAMTVIVGSIVSPILRLMESWDELQDARNAVERLNDVFDAQTEDAAGCGQEGRMTLPDLKGKFRFDRVTFQYAPGQVKPTLSSLTFEIQAGKTVAVVGRSGCGKSTLAKLMLGLYLPNSGQVFLDGHDLRILDRRAVRSRIGVVPQEVFLFSGSIRENIAPGEENPPLEAVMRACRLAGAHEFISEMGMGYESKVGERGMCLSGGQRQRIALARALYRNPDVLILDEATSALDMESERTIQANLSTAQRGRTTVIIAHRLSTVQNADHILVLDKGTLVEQGSHSELLEKKGLYASLVRQQLSL